LRSHAAKRLHAAGPNGAGKTTFAREFLPYFAECKNFVNADLIAQGVSPFSPETAGVRAGRLMLEEIDHFARRGVDFGFETTLSGRAHLNLIRYLKHLRYGVNIFYLWVPNVEVALSRVRDRVSGGGHNIAEQVVRRRFDRSVRNFLVLYRALADSWTLFNNSDKIPSIIAFEKESNLRKIDEELFNRLIGLYGER
jgi:predicted ABC-type ATPase